MEITRQVQGDVLLLSPRGSRLDAAGALQFKESMRDALKNHPHRVVLDMKGVEYLDSSGLGALVACMKMLGEGRQLELARCEPLVIKVLQLTRMDRIVTLHETLPPLVDAPDAA